jgi:hypothetical protein
MPLSPRFLVLPILLSFAGCAPMDTTPGNNQGLADEAQAATPPPNSAGQDMSPRLVMPATGGPPVLAIPLGGGIYLPVTGGAPTPGIPVSP